MPTASELAAAINAALEDRRGAPLSQTAAVRLIREAGGEEYLYKNKQHHWAIAPAVLAALRKITDENVVWSMSHQHWRPRRPTDKPGRRQR